MATPLWQLRIDRIIQATKQLGAEEIRRRAAAVRAESGQTSHELAWWSETMFVDRELRRVRRSRDAALATQRVIAALEDAAGRSGLLGDDADVSCVADALRSVTRATIAGYAEPFGAQALGLAGSMPEPAYFPSPSTLSTLTGRRSA